MKINLNFLQDVFSISLRIEILGYPFILVDNCLATQQSRLKT